jgi:ParE-like toxin of type II bacterial toxin-antitoxin system
MPFTRLTCSMSKSHKSSAATPWLGSSIQVGASRRAHRQMFGCRNPLADEPKVGVLKGVRVVKFKVVTQQLLLAYQFDPKRNLLEILDVGPHENFYRQLQKYLDER